MPATLRALEELDSRLTRLEAQLCAALNQIEERLTELEYLISEEIMAGLTQPAAASAPPAEPLMPSAPRTYTGPEGIAGVLADTWLPGDWVEQYCATAETGD
jgi:hypothetical protein